MEKDEEDGTEVEKKQKKGHTGKEKERARRWKEQKRGGR